MGKLQGALGRTPRAFPFTRPSVRQLATLKHNSSTKVGGGAPTIDRTSQAKAPASSPTPRGPWETGVKVSRAGQVDKTTSTNNATGTSRTSGPTSAAMGTGTKMQASSPPTSGGNSSGGGGGIKAVALMLAAGAGVAAPIAVYKAQTDEDFRERLENSIPGAGELLKTLIGASILKQSTDQSDPNFDNTPRKPFVFSGDIGTSEAPRHAGETPAVEKDIVEETSSSDADSVSPLNSSESVTDVLSNASVPPNATVNDNDTESAPSTIDSSSATEADATITAEVQTNDNSWSSYLFGSSTSQDVTETKHTTESDDLSSSIKDQGNDTNEVVSMRSSDTEVRDSTEPQIDPDPTHSDSVSEEVDGEQNSSFGSNDSTSTIESIDTASETTDNPEQANRSWSSYFFSSSTTTDNHTANSAPDTDDIDAPPSNQEQGVTEIATDHVVAGNTHDKIEINETTNSDLDPENVVVRTLPESKSRLEHSDGEVTHITTDGTVLGDERETEDRQMDEQHDSLTEHTVQVIHDVGVASTNVVAAQPDTPMQSQADNHLATCKESSIQIQVDHQRGGSDNHCDDTVLLKDEETKGPQNLDNIVENPGSEVLSSPRALKESTEEVTEDHHRSVSTSDPDHAHEKNSFPPEIAESGSQTDTSSSLNVASDIDRSDQNQENNERSEETEASFEPTTEDAATTEAMSIANDSDEVTLIHLDPQHEADPAEANVESDRSGQDDSSKVAIDPVDGDIGGNEDSESMSVTMDSKSDCTDENEYKPDCPDKNSSSGPVTVESVVVSLSTAAVEELSQKRLNDLERLVQELEDALAQSKKMEELKMYKLKTQFEQHLSNIEDERREELTQLQTKLRQQGKVDLENQYYEMRERFLGILQQQEQIHEQSISGLIGDIALREKKKSEADAILQMGNDRAERTITLEKMYGRLKKVEIEMLTRRNLDKAASKSIHLISAMDVLRETFNNRQPLFTQVNNLRKLAEDDDFINSILDGIPESSLLHGVQTEAQITKNFLPLRVSVRRLAHVPEDGGLFSYILSGVVSLLTFERHGLASGESPDAIMARAEYYLDQGDLEQATIEVNQLSGVPRSEAMEWLVASRAFLETKQALDLCFTHCSLMRLSML